MDGEEDLGLILIKSLPVLPYRVKKRKDLAKLVRSQVIHEGARKAHLIRKKDISAAIKKMYRQQTDM